MFLYLLLAPNFFSNGEIIKYSTFIILIFEGYN